MARPPYVTLNFASAHPGRGLGQAVLVDHIALEIEQGRLRAGMRLPPVRVLEHQLGISKNTAQSAYDELVARGLLVSKSREGVFVAGQAHLEEPLEPLRPATAVRLRSLHMPRHPSASALELSMVMIDPELLPRKKLSDCMRSVLHSPGLQPFYDAQGHAGLRDAIAERLNARGMDVKAADIVLTTGSQQALDIVVRSLESKVIAIENPVYAYARQLFTSLSCQAVPLTLDPFRPVDLQEWEQAIAASRPSLLYIISSFQNPTGYSYSTAELECILELSEKYGFAILEDDWGSDMLSGSEYRPTLRAMGGENVLYVNSFTKKLWPALRLGYVVSNASCVETLVAAKRVSTLGNAGITEATLAEFIDRGYLDTHLKALNAALDDRYKHAVAVLRETLPDAVRFSLPGGGPTLWLDMPERVPLRELQERLLTRGIRISLTADHFYGKPHLTGIRLGFAYLPKEQLKHGVEVLVEELKPLLT